MKKNSYLTLLMLSLFFLCFVSCNKDKDKDKDPPDNSFTYHNNDVIVCALEDEDGNFTEKNISPWLITGGTFVLTDFDVTQGQDPDHHLQKGNTYTLDKDKQFRFVLGRKASKDVAATFNAACPPAHNTFNHTAGELNFWMKGTLSLKFYSGKTYTFPNTFFAQGHSGATNNWWFGNSGMTNSKTPIYIWDPYSTVYSVPIPIYFGEKCFGYISPTEDPNLSFKFLRGDELNVNWICLIGVYTKSQPPGPW
jgi:hypothetical protein